MPICSYLVHPASGSTQRLQAHLADMAECTVMPADNRELFILVTDTPDATAERSLQDRLRENTDILCLALTFAHNADEEPHHD